MKAGFRLRGGLVNRRREFAFSFDGEAMHGYAGDTLASALLANGRHFVARSFKYHRPRGILSAGVEEPSALVTLGKGPWTDPNTPATVAELHDDMVARSQNRLGSLDRDLLAVNDLLSPLLSAGFYYKTFMWPAAFWEKVYEPAIRRAAGLGALSGDDDPSRYDKGYRHCDLLVVGSGAAGLMAALAAGRAGLDVIVAEQDFLAGGRLNAERDTVGGKPSHAWAASAAAELASMGNVRLMLRTTVFGAYDHGIYGALERVPDLGDGRDRPRQVLWRIYSKRAVLAAGSIERPIAFGNNDRPGIMLAGAVREYANRYAVAAGRRVAVLTNNNDGWRTAHDLRERGVEVAAILDTRKDAGLAPPKGVRVVNGAVVAGTAGRKRLRSVTLGDGEELEADCLAVSGGWSPTVHLACHHRGRPEWDPAIAGFVPAGELPPGMAVAGAAAGSMGLDEALREGAEAGRAAARALGRRPPKVGVPRARGPLPFAIDPVWHLPSVGPRVWIDFQNDVTTRDIEQSHLEGFRSVEHLKRYTTLGMSTDQGKTANVPGLAVLAEISGKPIGEVGTTVFRPPYTPVPVGAFAGRARGAHFRPVRRTPSHRWAEQEGAVFVEAGPWLRAQWFPRPGERHWRESVDREVVATRAAVGICDVSTLGKIDIRGGDAGEFVDRVYSNGFASLPVGRARYGLMLREDGFAMDDGTTARLAEDHYAMTTTTANAGPVYRHLQFCRQCLWPDMDVALVDTTDQTAQFSVAGPNSRQLLERIVDPGFDISNEAFPFMACAPVGICGGVAATLFRISFSGELAYEVAVPARYGGDLFRVLLEAGEDLGAPPRHGADALGQEGLHRPRHGPPARAGPPRRHPAGRAETAGQGRRTRRRGALPRAGRPRPGGPRPRLDVVGRVFAGPAVAYRAGLRQAGAGAHGLGRQDGGPRPRQGHRGRDHQPAFHRPRREAAPWLTSGFPNPRRSAASRSRPGAPGSPR